MKNNNFQIVIIAVCLALFVFAVLIFSGLLPIGQKSTTKNLKGDINIWGTFSASEMAKVIEEINASNPDLSIKYKSISKDTYQNALVENFAAGTGPDLFFLPTDMILKQEKFINPIPYSTYPEKAYRDTFLDGAEIYLSDKGVLALPVVVDPMVVYYNKDIIANNGIAKIPDYWDEVLDLNGTLTKADANGLVSQSTIALGTYENINHAKDILAMLMLQSGNSIVQKQDGKYASILSEQMGARVAPAQSVMEFYSAFANPLSTAYSWNRGLESSRTAFTGGSLVFYVGYGSELFDIQSINPNLSFDVSQIFQTKGSNRRTLVAMNALAVAKSAKNPTLANSTAMLFMDPTNMQNMATAFSLPPARRDLLAKKPEDRYMRVFYDSAISGRGWLDPDTNATDKIFKDMVGNILSNKFDISSSLERANAELGLLLRK